MINNLIRFKVFLTIFIVNICFVVGIYVLANKLFLDDYFKFGNINSSSVFINMGNHSLHVESSHSFFYFTATVVVLGLVVTVIFAGLFEIIFIRRLTRIRDSIIQLSRAADMTARLEVTGNDELSYLVKMINQMLDTLEKTQKEISRQHKLEGIVEIGGTICHEINQPLTALAGYVDILLMKVPEDQVAIIERVNKIKVEASRMADLTRKLNLVLRKKEFVEKEYMKDVRILDIHN